MRDLTLKQEAITMDHKSVAMADGEKAIRTPDGDRLEYRDGAPLQRMSEYNEWIENTGQNLNYAARSRVQSRKIAQVRMETPLGGTVIVEIQPTQKSLPSTGKSLLPFNFHPSSHLHCCFKFPSIPETLAIPPRNRPSSPYRSDYCRRSSEGFCQKLARMERQSPRSGRRQGQGDQSSGWSDRRDLFQFETERRTTPGDSGDFFYCRKEIQVALSRQTQRGLRPGIELCNDKAQHALQQELSMLKSTFLSLQNQLGKDYISLF